MAPMPRKLCWLRSGKNNVGGITVGGITEREITEKAIQSRNQILKFFINLAGLLANFTPISLTATGISEKTKPA